MERYEKELNLPVLASVTRAVITLIEDHHDRWHKALTPVGATAQLLAELDEAAERIDAGTGDEIPLVDTPNGKVNPYVLQLLKVLKPRNRKGEQLDGGTPIPGVAAGLGDDEADRVALLMASAAASAFALVMRPGEDVMAMRDSNHPVYQVALQTDAHLWLTPTETKFSNIIGGRIAIALRQRFTPRAAVAAAAKRGKKNPPSTSGVLDFEIGVPEMNSDRQAAARNAMAEIVAAKKDSNWQLMLDLSEKAVAEFPDVEVNTPGGATVKPFEETANLARKRLGDAPQAQVVAAAVAAAPKEVAPGVTVIDVTAGVQAAAANDVPAFGGGAAYGDLPAHGKLVIRHTAAGGTVLEGNTPGDGHRQVLGSRGQRWSLTRDKRTSFLHSSKGKTADEDRIRNAAEALRRGGWDVEVVIDNTGAAPLKMTPDRRNRHLETRFAAKQQQRVDPHADNSDDGDGSTPAAAPVHVPTVVVLDDDLPEVPGVNAAIVQLCRDGEFDEDGEPFTDEGETDTAAEQPTGWSPDEDWETVDAAVLLRRAIAGDPAATAETIRRFSLGLLLPPPAQPADPFAGKTYEQLLDMVGKGVDGALDALRKKILDGDTVEEARPVTAPPATTMPVKAPVQLLTVPDTDIRDETTDMVVWILAADVSKATRRGLNQALMNRVKYRAGAKGNRIDTQTTTHKAESKFAVNVTIPAGIDRQHVLNLISMVAADQTLKLHGLTTPAAELVSA